MVRFKVIRGSHLLLALSALILAAVVVFILVQSGSSGKEPAYEFNRQTAGIQALSNDEAKALTAFASNPSIDASLHIEVVADKQGNPPLAGAPCILIYHTHTHEAYAQNLSDPYEAVEAWRTRDMQHSVVRVGAALAEELSELGYFVMHDTTDHELDDIDQAYVRSLKTLESYSMEFDLVIDLHRDGYVEGLLPRLNDGSNSYAQIMLLVGDGGEYTGVDAPDYEKNLAFAQALTAQMNKLKNGIARNVTVKQGRYNQHIGKTAALIEVGHNENTLQEALASVPVLAKSLDFILR